MIPTLTTAPLEFQSAQAALDYLDRRVLQRFTLPLRDLRVSAAGRLRHESHVPVSQLDDVPLTDAALDHLNDLTGIPRTYARRIEPELHEHSLNELMASRLGLVTVVVEYEHGQPERRRVAAIVTGARSGIEDEIVLRRIEQLGVGSFVTLHRGSLDVRFGQLAAVEVLPEDTFEVTGALRNEHWGAERAAMRPFLDVSVHLLRLICTNGAIVQRALADAKLSGWANRSAIDDFISRQIERVLTFPAKTLRDAVAIMSAEIPSDDEVDRIRNLLARYVHKKHADELLRTAVSWYDFWNAVTAAAHHVVCAHRRRKLQIEGGAMMDMFMYLS
jgi:hypothetical protein